jgi:Flp pilus assembly protein TadB
VSISFWPLYCLLFCVISCPPLFVLFLFFAIVLLVFLYIMFPTVFYFSFSQTDNIMAKKQKDKKINNGWHNNTQTNRQYNGQETKRQKDSLFFCLFVSWPLYCLFVCVLLCRPLFIFLSFCFLAIILSVCLCIIETNRQYNGQESKRQKDKQRLTQ